MQNNFEPIDPTKVIVDTEPELIDPRKVVIHPAMSAADRRRVYNSFSGDPLAFIADEGERLYLRHVTEQLPDRDEYRKRMALAAYFTHENKGSNFSFNMHNLDGILESFYRRKISVDEAYSDFQKMYGVEKSSTLKELPGVLKEDLAALGAGSLELASTLAATYLKVAKWGSDLQASILSPLMSEEQKKMAFGYGKLLENIGQEVAVKENRRIIQKLDKASNANPEFVTDLFTGDFDQVSARDFTKALARSAPSMAFQILAGAAAGPWLLPTIIGTQTVAMKDYEVNDKHPEWDGSKKWSYIGLSAANEALFEIVTSKIVGGKMSREAGAKLIQQGLLKYMGKSFAKEGGSEGAQQLLSNITDLVYDIDGNRNQLNGMQLLARVFAGVPEAGFIGGVWGFPEGVTGYFSARRVAGIVNDTRVKHENIATKLSAKDELSDAEAAQLEVSRKILEAGTPQEMLALDHINDTLKKVQEDEDIQNSPTYRDIEKTAAYATSDEELVAAVKAERKNSFDVTATWNVADVADAVTDISKIFKDTVFHVIDNWQNVADIPNLDMRKRAAYNIETGEVYINAAAVRPHEVPQIILHEVVGHKGLRSVLKGADLDSVLDQVYRDHCQEQSFKDIAARYFKPVELVDEDGVPYLDISLDKIGDQRLAAEEYIAHIAETKVKPKWWKEVLQKVRMAFAKVFGKEFRMSDNQIETLLARASRKVRRNRFGRESSVVTVNTATDKQNLDVDGQDGLRFSIIGERGAASSRFENLPYYNIPFADSVDAVINGEYTGDGLIFVRDTPEALKRIGIPALPIMITRRHIKDIYNNYAPAGRNAHNMGEQLKQLPQMLEKPVAVIAAEQTDCIIVITQYRDKKGNDIMVPVIIGKNLNANGNVWISANIAATAYGKQSVKEMLAAAIEKEKSGEIAIFGANKKIASKLPYSGLQLSSGGGFNTVHNINDDNSPVKLDVKKNTKSLQFKRWFGDSIVVDEKGEPMKVYHGSSADFTVFDHRFGYRNGAAEGRGFYFTSDQSKAEGYKTENGKLFEVYLRLQKPLSPDKLTITKAEVEKIIRAIDTDGMYVADYAQDDIGYPGKAWHNKAVRSAVNAIYDSSDNNADIVAEIYSVFGQGDALAKITEATGYDGFVKGDVFVVFNPNQIKSSTDNIGTFDISNPDIRFSIADFSEEQQRNIMDILSPFVGDVVERDREEYADYLASRGVKNVSPDDAFHFALEIVRRKHLTALAARRAKRDNWLYDNILEYKWAVDFSGSSSFQIKLSPRFRGKDTSGTFWLGKKDKGTPVINLDELARYVADEIGGNELDIEQQLFDFYNDLTWVELRKEYTKYRKEMIAADRDADRQAKEEFLEQEKFRIQDEIVQIFSDGKPVVNEQWINENRDVFKELYKKIFPDRNPPYTPSQADIEAINMALVQESGNADVYAQAFKDAKEKAWQQYSGKLKELREKVLSSMTDAVRLQREAVAFAQKNLPRTNQSEFVRNIVGLLEYSNAPSARFPEGRRKTEFDKIIARMTERAAEVRKTELLDKIAKRLQQLGERTDSGRRVRGMRDIDTQRRLNRIIAISRLDAGSLNMAITENQKKIEELLSLGADTSELEYDIALLNRYGTLWNKSAGEVNSAFEHLQMLARSGKDNLLAEINKRAADDEYDRNELWRAVNGGRRYNDIEQKTLADKNTKSARAKKNLDKTFWQSLSFDGMLEAMALFANDENVVNRFRQMAHEAKLAKDVLNSSNSDDCHEFLKKLLKTKSPFTIAEKIGKWREIQVQTGVKRFVPDPDARQFEYERLSVDQARVMLQNYDAGKKNMPDYEAEAIRQQLSTLDRKIKYDVPEEFRDGATDQLMKIIRAENEGSKEPVVIIPRQTFNGASQEVPLTQMQALYLKLMWDQKDIRFKMHYNGYTQETMQQIDKFLLPEVKAFGAWMRSQLEADRSRIEEVYRQMYFAEFPKEDNYFPAVYKVSGNNVNGQSVDIAQPGSAAGAVAYTPGALKVRVYHLKAIRSDTDALTVFQNHRLMMNHFVTHAAAARKMRSVLLSSDVKNAIESEHGIVAYQELKTALQDFINGGNIDVDVNSMVSKIYGNAVRSKMAANVISGIKQTMGAISYLQEIPPDALAKGMAYAAAHPKEVWRTLGNTDYFRIRWNSGANADLRLLLDASGRDASMASVFFDAVDNISTLPLRLGDAASVLFGGFAVYKYHYDNLVKFGMDHAQARREALQKWEMATERTQQSSAPFLLNKFQRGGAESRIFTTFTSNQILLWNNYASAIYKSVHYGKTAPLKKAVRGIAALILSSAAMTVFDQMKEHYKDDKYQWGELFFNVLADAVTGFGPFGRIASEVISAAKPDGFMPSNFWSSDIIMGYYAVERQLGKNKKISDNAYVDAVRLLQAAGYFLKPAAQAGAIAREARKIYKISNEK